MQELSSTSEIIEALGGIGPTATLTHRNYNAVSNWKALGRFPPNTADAMRDALAKRGFTAPRSLWRMIEPAGG